MTHSLVVRLDSAGDVLLAGPAIRAVAAGSRRVTLLCGPRGAEAGRLLPGVDEVITWHSPWVDPHPQPVRSEDVEDLVSAVRERSPDRALVLTSFHQSPLPTALVLRLAGVPWVGAVSEDYPGSLLDLRHHVPSRIHEVERSLSLVRAAGYDLPPDDDGRLAVRTAVSPWLPWQDIPEGPSHARAPAYVAVHPGASVAARAWPETGWQRLVETLVDQGHRVVVTGGPEERALTARVAGAAFGSRRGAGGQVLDLGGATTLATLAGVLSAASVVVAANTGPAHLAAAVRTPVVSLFAPTVPFECWRPWGVPVVTLGRGDAPCRDTRATTCPVAGHPCLSEVTPTDVVRAVESLLPPAGTLPVKRQVPALWTSARSALGGVT
ncbi:glycosyltransferase family 9 protein [Humibacillus xanthopallidus]|uniref:ADP-heptose:LPS heptosyltransferase n=1 Tax=Humibacillus xanthopallidus TaxID=412689 RepID=A0A543HHT8_9MICO|nr:glycosyltransferase family 9 protein [Humibacillus xanthopallidus]TQM57895.1 ADP-heptose:LPS heptosyltransferase [Humibacillus xanthopallidus]